MTDDDEERERVLDLGRELRAATKGLPTREAEAAIHERLADMPYLAGYELDEITERALGLIDDGPEPEPQQHPAEAPAEASEHRPVRRRLSSLYRTPSLAGR